ncbi:MAG: Rap1a/Tai family immunity protein [Alphaproteobacteria bacterium]|jgi:hypothetical protein|nr:Rap1a/Tai family immunity protein [Alphaproteobacteria bacterium]
MTRYTSFILVILFLPLCLLPTQTRAEESRIFISAAYLYEICARDEDGNEVVQGGHTACQAYIAGVIDYHNLLETLGTAPSIHVCVSNNAALGDLQDIVWDYLDRNAQHDAFAAAPAITLALSNAFPCKRKKK